MRILELKISHFRGIQSADIIFPDTSRILCLIGAGDSTKSTILNAIEWVSWSTKNLAVNDTDFYNQDIENPIIITGSFAEIPKALMQEDKFGFYLRRPHVSLESNGNNEVDDEPKDDAPIVLTVQLTVGSDLEPKWEVVCNRRDPKIISANDRRLLFVGSVGENCSKDLSWGRSSVLQKYEDAQEALHNARTQALRAATQSIDLHELDEIQDTILEIGKQYGVAFDSDINNRLQLQNNGTSFSIIGLYDGKTPLTQKGTGSQRLLSMGLNISATEKTGILLIDEIEIGLEPYRLRTLINELRSTYSKSGQVIITTHSPITVAECKVSELMVVHSDSGQTKVIGLEGPDKNTNNAIQKTLRANPEAFLCKRIIVCEGKTEIGFIRSLDKYLSKSQNFHIAYKGVGTADGSGQNIYLYAKTLADCGYQVCVLMDSDDPHECENKQLMRAANIKIFDWDNSNAFEEQIFSDVPISIANQLLSIAVEQRDLSSITSKFKDKNISYKIDDNKLILDNSNTINMKSIGTIAKGRKIDKKEEKGWYKRIDLGESVGDIIFGNLDQIDSNSKLIRTINGLISWVNDDEQAGSNSNFTNE